MRKVTIVTIARAAGVSVGTVDRALNGRGRISDETKKRVLAAADDLGYRPNKIASALGRQRKFRIAVITPANPAYFHNEMQRGVLDAQKDLSDYGMQIDLLLCDCLAVEDQKKILTSLDPDQYDGIALNASGDALNGVINGFVERGIPVVTFNSDAPGSKRLFFVGEDAYKSGCLAGDMMGKLLGGRGKVAALISFYNPSSSLSRRQGFVDVLAADYPGITVASEHEYRDSDQLAQEAVREAFETHPDLVGVFANSASGTVAAGDYVDCHCPGPRRPCVIGYDVTEPVEGFLQRGACEMIIDQDPRKQSYYGVMLLARHLMERWTPASKMLEIRVKLVMRHNALDHTMVRDLSSHILT